MPNLINGHAVANGGPSEGKPPPAPEDAFPVDINDTKAMVRYAWVELGPEERESLGLLERQCGKPARL